MLFFYSSPDSHADFHSIYYGNEEIIFHFWSKKEELFSFVVFILFFNWIFFFFNGPLVWSPKLRWIRKKLTSNRIKENHSTTKRERKRWIKKKYWIEYSNTITRIQWQDFTHVDFLYCCTVVFFSEWGNGSITLLMKWNQF